MRVKAVLVYLSLCVGGAAHSACLPADATLAITLASAPNSSPERAELCKGEVVTLRVSDPYKTVMVGVPDIVEITPISNDALTLTGLSSGSSSVVLLSEDKDRFATLQVSVIDPDNKAEAEQGDPFHHCDRREVRTIRGTTLSISSCGCDCLN